MNVMILLLFIGVVLVTFAVGFFIWNVRSGTLQHVDRLALLPLGAEGASRVDGTTRERADNASEADACSKGHR